MNLSEEDLSLYSALAEAILDADRLTTLDSFERWRSITPVPLDQPWEIKHQDKCATIACQILPDFATE